MGVEEEPPELDIPSLEQKAEKALGILKGLNQPSSLILLKVPTAKRITSVWPEMRHSFVPETEPPTCDVTKGYKRWLEWLWESYLYDFRELCYLSGVWDEQAKQILPGLRSSMILLPGGVIGEQAEKFMTLMAYSGLGMGKE